MNDVDKLASISRHNGFLECQNKVMEVVVRYQKQYFLQFSTDIVLRQLCDELSTIKYEAQK